MQMNEETGTPPVCTSMLKESHKLNYAVAHIYSNYKLLRTYMVYCIRKEMQITAPLRDV